MRALVVWFNMIEGDDAARWPKAVFTDRRVQHRWDEPKDAGRWFLDNLRTLRPSHDVNGKFPQRVDAMWDTWMLFDRTARWQDVPGGLLSWGYTIMQTRGQLQDEFDALFGTPR